MVNTTLFVLSQLVQEPLKIKKEPMAFLTLVGLGSVLLSPPILTPLNLN